MSCLYDSIMVYCLLFRWPFDEASLRVWFKERFPGRGGQMGGAICSFSVVTGAF